jgi:hypothetical protein
MTSLRRPRVLVIGAGAIANTLANLLTALDCGVERRPDGRDVLPERHDVVFVDLDVLGLDAWQLAKRVQRTREQGLVILLHGGVVTLADTDRAERLHAWLLPKPTTLEEFRILIERAFPAAGAPREPVRVG